MIKNDLKYLFDYFIVIGVISFVFSIYYILSTEDNAIAENFIVMGGRICRPIEYHGGGKGRPYLYFRVSRYPHTDFSSSDPILIENKQKLLDSVSYGNATSLGDSVYFTVYKNDFNSIKKSTIQDLYGKRFGVLSFEKNNLSFLKFDLKKYNDANNLGRKKGFVVCILLSILFIGLGIFKWRKNAKY